MGRPFKLMYQKAEDFLYSCRGKYEIVISDLTSREIIDRTYYCKQEIIDFIKKYRIEIIEI
jgi:hypothetical protein